MVAEHEPEAQSNFPPFPSTPPTTKKIAKYDSQHEQMEEGKEGEKEGEKGQDESWLTLHQKRWCKGDGAAADNQGEGARLKRKRGSAVEVQSVEVEGSESERSICSSIVVVRV